MKIKNGKIRNINRKLIAGAMVFALAAPLAGCDSISIDNINYVSTEQGNIDFTIDYKTLEHCAFYKVRNSKEENLYYTICLRDDFNGTYEVKYYDIFTGKELKYSDYTFRMVESLDNYLTEGKVEYTEEDLKEMLNKYIENIEQTKKLVKE